jgi:hypothetical protein
VSDSGPHDPEEPTDERLTVEGPDDAPLARTLPFVIPEIPFDGPHRRLGSGQVGLARCQAPL